MPKSVTSARPVAALDENVLGLHVAVDHAVRVRVGERSATSRSSRTTSRGSRRPACADALRQRLAVDEAHDEEDVAADLVGAVDRHDVLVRQRARGARLAQKALAHDRVVGEMRRQRLDGDAPVEPEVAREVDDAHAAAADLTLAARIVRRARRRTARIRRFVRASGWSSRSIRVSHRRCVAPIAQLRIHYIWTGTSRSPFEMLGRHLEHFARDPLNPFGDEPMATQTLPVGTEAHDTFPINGTDYVEFYVGNAKQAAHFYQSAFGFQLTAYRGPETGTRDRASYLLTQNKIRLVLTTPLGPDGEIADHVRKHGDGVRDIALWVDDARDAYAKAIERGASRLRAARRCATTTARSSSPASRSTATRSTRSSSARTIAACSCPAFRNANRTTRRPRRACCTSTTASANVELGKMNEWVGFYERVMGFKNLISFDDEDISTEYSSLMSKVMSNGNERIKFPINEPAAGKKKSQIDEYLDFYRRAGRAASGAGDGRHHRHGDGAARPRRRVPPRADDLLRRAAGPRRQDRRADRPARGARHSRRPRSRRLSAADLLEAGARTGRRCSTRSSSEKARAASERATSRRCSKRSSKSRRCEEICRVRTIVLGTEGLGSGASGLVPDP